MIRNKEWHSYAIQTIKKIREFRQQSPLGYYSSPEEYMNTLEDFGKLFYDINKMPDEVYMQFISTRNSFDIFKNKVSNLCDILLKKVENDNDTPKDKETSESA